jgi:ribonuclease D
MNEQDFTWVRDETGLRDLASALEAEPAHALDLESNSGFAYFEYLCLMQWNVGGRLWMVDLVELRQRNLGIDALRPALEDPQRRTWLHGGEFDVGCLKRDFQLQVRGVWDSQQASSLLGWEKTGYGALVERILGVALPKQYAHYDWSRRPIATEPVLYALDDVRYLPRVCAALEQEIEAADLEEELVIANETVEEAEWSGGFEADAIWKVKGAGRLPKEALPRLVTLHRWRDGVARDLDLPPGRVINNKALLAMSQAQPQSPRELRRLGLRGHLATHHGEELLRLLEQAKTDPPPVPPAPEGRRVPNEERARELGLKEWRRKEAERREVPQQVVLPARALAYLKRHGAEDLSSVPQLGVKRSRLYGEILKELASLGPS